jgi:phospholipid/cholesterol/gamma-HCH transport system substrate-binding protein
LGAFADQATPVLTDLHAQAANINTVIEQLGPFSSAALPAFRTLGQAAEIGGPALTKSRPTIQELGRFAKAAKPVARNAALLLDNFQKTGGVERLMDYLFYQVAAINGFDQYGHYLRAALIVNLCSTYAIAPSGGCSANLPNPVSASSHLTAAQADELKTRAAALAGTVPVTTGARTTPATSKSRAGKPIALPKIALPGRLGQVLSQGTKTTAPAPKIEDPLGAKTASPAPDPRQGLLDYLLGSGS